MTITTGTEQVLSESELAALPKGTVLGAAHHPGGDRRYFVKDDVNPAYPWLQLPSVATVHPDRFSDAGVVCAGPFFEVAFAPLP